VVDDITKMLPITKIVVETASFDVQKIKNPDIEGEKYQQGEQMGFWNIREYVLFRDKHTCQHCKGKNKILNVHHIESRKTGGDRPENLITLCETCHKAYHQGKIELKNKSNNLCFRDAAFMGIMRWAFYNELKEQYENVSHTYGYITKNTRIKTGLDKGHAVDARCIAGHPNVEPADCVYLFKKIRRHNRKIHKANILKGGKKKRNQANYLVKGFRLFDKVIFEKKVCFVTGRRTTGYFALKDIHGNSVHKSASWKKLKLAEISAGYMIQKKERRTGKAIPAPLSLSLRSGRILAGSFR
jgi:N6-L-threonylcarbamoyladenine synthase